MRSFTLSVFASLAFGLFCSAAPTPADLPPVPADVPAVPTNTKSLTDILGDLAATVGPIKDQIRKSHIIRSFFCDQLLT